MRVTQAPAAGTERVDETAHVLWAVSQSPQVVLSPGWCLDVRPDRWVLVTERDRPARTSPQPTLLGAGSAAQHVVLALESRQLHVEVVLLPPADPTALASVDLIGLLPGGDLALAPRRSRTIEHLGSVQPSELRQLNLAAEAFGVEVLWSSPLVSSYRTRGLQRVRAGDAPRPMATLVTAGDTARDQLHAGRALAQVLRRARVLGLQTTVDLHVLGQREIREELRRIWSLEAYPQVQLTITAP